MRAALAAAIVLVAMTTSTTSAEILRFADLEGWAEDDHIAALAFPGPWREKLVAAMDAAVR